MLCCAGLIAIMCWYFLLCDVVNRLRHTVVCQGWVDTWMEGLRWWNEMPNAQQSTKLTNFTDRWMKCGLMLKLPQRRYKQIPINTCAVHVLWCRIWHFWSYFGLYFFFQVDAIILLFVSELSENLNSSKIFVRSFCLLFSSLPPFLLVHTTIYCYSIDVRFLSVLGPVVWYFIFVNNVINWWVSDFQKFDCRFLKMWKRRFHLLLRRFVWNGLIGKELATVDYTW